MAAASNNTALASLLLEHGADINAKAQDGSLKRLVGDWTPLHAAVAANGTAMVELLLAGSTDINAIDKVGVNPLPLATCQSSYVGWPYTSPCGSAGEQL